MAANIDQHTVVFRINFVVQLLVGTAISDLSYRFSIIIYSCRHSLKEVLDAPNVMSLIKDTKATQEVPSKPK